MKKPTLWREGEAVGWKRFRAVTSNRLLKMSFFAGCSKMPKCKAPEILRNEAYSDVRRNKPAPCLTRGRIRETQQMGVFQQPSKRSDSGVPST
jgi:hypothetical protein